MDSPFDNHKIFLDTCVKAVHYLTETNMLNKVLNHLLSQFAHLISNDLKNVFHFCNLMKKDDLTDNDARWISKLSAVERANMINILTFPVNVEELMEWIDDNATNMTSNEYKNYCDYLMYVKKARDVSCINFNKV